MLTWQAHDGRGFEGVRVHFGAGKAFRALGRIVRAEPGGDWTASYRLVLNEDGGVQRASFTTATAERERHLTLNRTEDGFWLLDTGSGGTRTDFSGSIDIDLAGSVTFDALPVRRLDLHREAGEHTLPVVHVALPSSRPPSSTRRIGWCPRATAPSSSSGRATSPPTCASTATASSSTTRAWQAATSRNPRRADRRVRPPGRPSRPSPT